MPVTQQSDTTSYIQFRLRVDTIYQHDSIYLRDSIIYRERTIRDTVFVTKEVYKDSRKLNVESQKSVRTDTVRDTQYVEKIIEKPPEKYVPKFYKWCTIALWAIGLLAIGYGLLKWRMKCRV